MEDEVILVNAEDEVLGYMNKLEAHQKGLLHRAFSVFLFNAEGELLLQQRAFNKYHSAGLWSNTCCSHPRKDEGIVEAANRRLMEEMGIESMLIPLYSFVYQAPMENNLIEHEFDHVLVGLSNAEPVLNSYEVNDWKYISEKELLTDIEQAPEKYTIWFKICLQEVLKKVASSKVFFLM